MNNGATGMHPYQYDTFGRLTTSDKWGSRSVVMENISNNTLDFFYDSNGNAYALKYNGILYYITNLQGDVMSIVDGQGAVVASYNYDPYGNLISDEPAENTVGHLNPLRYRAYYYDSESELYYLQSRYYDPELGRFINADAFASTGQGVLGNNMFAYCNNNVVNLADSGGTRSQMCIDDQFNAMRMPWQDSPIGGKSAYSLIQSSGPENPWIMGIVARYVMNSDEQAVLDAEHFAFYKGILVIRTNLDRSGSFGILFISRKENMRDNPEDVVRHEHGHTVQLAQLGIVKYAFCIFVPSCFQWGSNPEYYRRPWEITADIFGGVQSRSYPGYEAAGFEYLLNSNMWGILAWTTIE